MLSLLLGAAGEKHNVRSLLEVSKTLRNITRYGAILVNPGAQRAMFGLLRHETYSQIPRLQPMFPFKYRHERLLCIGLSQPDRIRCLLTNYGFLKSKLTKDALRRIVLTETGLLFDVAKDEHRYQIIFCLSKTHHLEGEMSLLFKVDGATVWLLSFTILPGDIVRCRADFAVLVSCVQSARERQREIHDAGRILGVSPAKALLDALQGLARAFGITDLACVSARRQPCFTAESADFSRTRTIASGRRMDLAAMGMAFSQARFRFQRSRWTRFGKRTVEGQKRDNECVPKSKIRHLPLLRTIAAISPRQSRWPVPSGIVEVAG